MLAEAAHAPRDGRAIGVAAIGCGVLAAFLIAPRSTPLLLALLTGAVLVAAIRVEPLSGRSGASANAAVARLRAGLARLPLPVASMLALAAWGLVTVLWAADRGEAIGKVAMLAAFVLGVQMVQAVRSDLPDELLRQLVRAAFIAFAAALAFLCVEEVSGHLIKRMLITVLPWIGPSAKHAGYANYRGTWELIYAAHLTNRNMAAIVLTLWPMLLVAWHIRVGHMGAGERRWLTPLAVLAVAAAAILSSRHETSLVALVASVATFLIVRQWPRRGLEMVAVGWLAATLLVVPIAGWAFGSAGLHQASWLPHTARQRVILWGYTAQQVALRPILGVGVDSTKPLDARRGPQVETPPGYVYQLRTGPHGHNVFLQTWYELGAPGALLLCAFGLATLVAISRLTATALPAMAAAFVSATITAAFSWGMWQSWFMAAFALSAVLCLLAVEYDRRQGAMRADGAVDG